METKSTTSLNLIDVLKEVFNNGASARRKEWPKVNLVGMKEGKLTILLDDGENHPWTISDEDIAAIDWEIIDA